MPARVIIDPPADGAWNMAVDESLLASAATGITTLRFYAWLPATLSLGYFQPGAAREAHAASCDCPVVRRASGGGAILHQHELTYSFAVPAGDRFHQQAEQIYDLFHHTLRETLTEWQIIAHFFRELNEPAPREDAFLCFERRSPNDLILGGKKIVGSAQRRHQGALLQHGSLLLRQSPFAPELPGVEELSGQQLAAEEIIPRWLPRLSSTLGLVFNPGELTSEERTSAEAWQVNRFATAEWNQRR